ncbi:STAS domain-containing protein [Neorhodopirellula pilleata]|uniref:STAS domain protein n=1 Tax=Neorhodopirellula pilleata TaxID=2714738 RepID=A0A5C6AGX6_9BACT|nr:STAS domain-containing protein [Neorhodopirellula pilleata]TWT98700.1 STAS domain protein [Neorhodopirellula pilleata]
MSLITRQGHVTVVTLNQPLRQEAVDEISSRIDDAMRDGIPNLVMDLSQTPLIDGAGLQWLDDLDMEAADRGGCVRLCNANELCIDILRMTGVGDRLDHYPSLPAAMASFVR